MYILPPLIHFKFSSVSSIKIYKVEPKSTAIKFKKKANEKSISVGYHCLKKYVSGEIIIVRIKAKFPFFLSHVKALRTCVVLGIEPVTSRSAVQRYELNLPFSGSVNYRFPCPSLE